MNVSCQGKHSICHFGFFVPQVCQPWFRPISGWKNITGKILCLITYRQSYVLKMYWLCGRMARPYFVNFYLVSWETSLKINVSALAVSICKVWFEENHRIKKKVNKHSCIFKSRVTICSCKLRCLNKCSFFFSGGDQFRLSGKAMSQSIGLGVPTHCSQQVVQTGGCQQS